MGVTDLLNVCRELSRWQVALAIFVTAILAEVIHTFHTWWRLRHIPGSLAASLSQYWQIKTQFHGDWYLETKKLADKYGELVRVGPNQLLTSDIDHIRRMAHSKSAYTKGNFYQTFRMIPTQDHSFSQLDDSKHSELRKKLGHGYSGSVHSEDVVSRQVNRLTSLIERKFLSTASENKPLNMTKLSYLFSADCVGDLSFGGPFGCLDEGKDVFQYQKWNDGFFPVAIVIANLTWLAKLFFKPPFNKLYPSEHDKEGVGKYLECAKKIVHQRFQPDVKQSKDVIGSFITNGATPEEIINELMLQVVAGTDTTATAFRMTLLHLCATPHVYNRLQAEIDETIARGLISSPIKDTEARQLPYLQAVIKEGLRIFPVVTATFYKKVPKGGDYVCGYFVPEGTEIGHNVLAVMRSPRYWGHDADVFRPERWLEASPTNLERMTNALETLFGAGRYKCLGRAMAQMELNKVFVELLRRFDLSIMAPQAPVRLQNWGFFVMSDLNMRATKRVIKMSPVAT